VTPNRPEIERVASSAGRSHPATVPLSARELGAFGHRVERIVPVTRAELDEIVRWAEASGRTILPAGSGSRAHVGNPPPDGAIVVSLERFQRVVRYEPDDFTIGVEAGLATSELWDILRSNRQEIGVDLPPVPGGTVGGLVATAFPSVRLARCGPLRASVIGLSGLRGGPRPWKSGGMVVKNVAGYEVAKFVVGALGTTGFILGSNFRLRPVPAARVVLRIGFESLESAGDFAARSRSLRLEPAYAGILDVACAQRLAESIDGPAPTGDRELVVIYEGNASLVSWLGARTIAMARETGHDLLESLEAERAARALGALAAFGEPDTDSARPSVIRDDEVVVRFSNLPSRVVAAVKSLEGIGAAHGVEQLAIAADAATGQIIARIRCAGIGSGELAAPLDAASSTLGPGVVITAPRSRPGAWPFLLSAPPSTAPEAQLAERIRSVFDPRRIFFPGRMRHEDPSASRLASGAT
jgi:glycolate oxidase FAD binding subunit